MHEQRRRDRTSFVSFHCDKLAGYADAKRHAADNKFNDFDPAQTTEERMASMYAFLSTASGHGPLNESHRCTKRQIAKKYLPHAIPYMLDLIGDQPRKQLFDYGSIMIYGFAKNGGGVEPRPYDAWPLTRKPASDQRPSYTGGSPDDEKAVPSIQNVLRVAALYPSKDPEKQQRLKELDKEQMWEPLKVEIEGLVTTTVTSLPTDVAEVP